MVDTPGNGLMVPVASASALDPVVPEPRQASAKRLLVIEDDPGMRALEVMLLTDDGFAVDAVSNGQDAVAKAEATHYDAIVLDIGLPDLDGFEIARQIQALVANRRTPLVMVTGTREPGARRLGFQTGVVVFMQKPVTPSTFRAAVQSVL